jgi:hypothetical protein
MHLITISTIVPGNYPGHESASLFFEILPQKQLPYTALLAFHIA